MRLLQLSVFISLNLLVAAATADSGSSSDLPQCAAVCQQDLFDDNTTTCASGDATCLCADDHYQTALSGCVKTQCTVREAFATQHLHDLQCGIPIHRRYPVANAGTIVTLVLATILFAIRISAKFMRLAGGWGPDDYTIIAAYCLGVIIYSLNASVAHYGFGMDMWNIVPQDNITMAYKRFYVYVLVYKAQISLAKISVCLFLVRIFSSRQFRYITYTIIGINAGIAISWILADALQCIPVRLAWTGWEQLEQGQCIDFVKSTVANGLVNIIVDFIMIVMPIYEVVKLRLSVRKKLGVALVFAAGLALTIVGVLRVVVMFTTKEWKTNPTAKLSPVNHLSTIECQIAVVCACLPMCRAMLAHFFPKLVGDSQAETYPHGTGKMTRTGRSGRTAGDNHISKTVSYTVDCSSIPETRSDSLVHLVAFDPDTRENASTERW